MGWEIRGERRYYTRSRRVNGRVVREYVGAGLVGILAAQQDAQRRQGRAQAREQLRQDQEAFAAAAAPHQRLAVISDALMRATLMSAGYHQPNRSVWRKRRGG